MAAVSAALPEERGREQVESVVIRFAGDSGDGVQITGGQFTETTALAGNDLATFPDFPAEIRAPAGTTFGVSAFQINFGARNINTSGDVADVLVAFNPAALKVNMKQLPSGSLIIVDSGTFNKRNMQKAGFDENPLENDTLDKFRTLKIDISKHTLEAVKDQGLTSKEGLRCKNFWTLGLVYWLYDRDRGPTIDWLNAKFKNRPEIAKANVAALNAGHAFAETAEMPNDIGAYAVPPAQLEPGLYRNITGTEAAAWGLVAGAQLASAPMAFCSYPITPASALLHVLARLKEYDVLTFQAEDEIAAACSAIGASYAGAIGVTSSSGPGVALKGEAIGLAISTELPLVIVNSQRAGPSTGLPTKTEQSDLFQSVYGRNADSPLVVIASKSPGDCFDCAIEAIRLATKYMTPVIFLTDGYLANAAEPWRIPDMAEYEPFPVQFHKDTEGFHPFLRDEETLARAWAKPGTPGLEHRIGGIEKDYNSGHISYEPENHHKMVKIRAEKINNIANDIPKQEINSGKVGGNIAVVGWGSTYGPIARAVANSQDNGLDVSHIHIRHIWPLPRNLGELLTSYDKVLVPEMNNGQLSTLLRSEYLVDAVGLNQINGQPFKIATIEQAIQDLVES